MIAEKSLKSNDYGNFTQDRMIFEILLEWNDCRQFTKYRIIFKISIILKTLSKCLSKLHLIRRFFKMSLIIDFCPNITQSNV